MDSAFWTVIGTGFLSIAVAAWQKPSFYMEFIFVWLRRIILFACFGMAIWQFSASHSVSAAVRLVPGLKLEDLQSLNEATFVPNIAWIALVGTSVYCAAVYLFAHALQEHEQKNRA